MKFYNKLYGSFFFILFVLALIVDCLGSDQNRKDDPSAVELAQLNEQFWNSFINITIDYSVDYYALDVNPQYKSYQYDAVWSSFPDSEFLKQKIFKTSNDGSTKDRSLLNYNSKYWIYDEQLFQLDFVDENKSPSSFKNALELGLRGYIYPSKTNEYYDIAPYSHLISPYSFPFHFSGSENSEQHTLLSIIKKNEISKPVRVVENHEDTIWRFKIFPGSRIDETNEEKYMEVDINESKSYLIQRVRFFAPLTDAVTREKIAFVDEMAVLDYIKINDEEDKYFPKEVVFRLGEASQPDTMIMRERCFVRSVSVNNLTQDKEAGFSMPEFVSVTHYPMLNKNGKNYYVMSVWGKDNKPEVTFYEPEEYGSYSDKVFSEKEVFSISKRPISISRILLCIAGIIMIFLAVVIKKRMRT